MRYVVVLHQYQDLLDNVIVLVLPIPSAAGDVEAACADAKPQFNPNREGKCPYWTITNFRDCRTPSASSSR